MGLEEHNRVVFVHLTLVPYLETSGEIKTKPTQHSVKELRSIGIQPDILLCRSRRELPLTERKKIALFTNVREQDVISAIDLHNIYRIPLWFHEQKVDQLVVSKLALNNTPPANLSEWEGIAAQYDNLYEYLYGNAHNSAHNSAHGSAHNNSQQPVKIALVGKYVSLIDAYISVNEALTHAGLALRTGVEIVYISTDQLEQDINSLGAVSGILVPGGFGERGIEGKVLAARYAREKKVPYLGICLGMQVAVIEFARHVAALAAANSSEFAPQTPHPVIALVSEWQDAHGQLQQRDAGCDLGGTMRLGVQPCRLDKHSKSYAHYQAEIIEERHRHRYELNNHYKAQLLAAGLQFAGHSADKELVEIIELADHPWFVGTQFHPEFSSTPRQAHPLFRGFVESAIAHQRAAQNS